MAGSNFYFNNYTNSGEQNLIESLIVETMGIYGHSVYYCPRTIIAKDDIYGEDAVSEYNGSYLVDMYIKNFEAYEGDGSFLSKFNLEIRDQTTFTVARRLFGSEITSLTEITRPREGDLIYSPMLKRLMVIKYVNNTSVFYQMGALQTWDLVCEAFEYSSERLNTGIPDIDNIESEFSVNEETGIITDENYHIADDDGFAIILGQNNYDEQNADTFSDNKEFMEEGEDVVDWSNRDPFSEPIS